MFDPQKAVITIGGVELKGVKLESIEIFRCSKCIDKHWVCENHPKVPWNDGEGCCGGTGMLCSCVKVIRKKNE